VLVSWEVKRKDTLYRAKRVTYECNAWDRVPVYVRMCEMCAYVIESRKNCSDSKGEEFVLWALQFRRKQYIPSRTCISTEICALSSLSKKKACKIKRALIFAIFYFNAKKMSIWILIYDDGMLRENIEFSKKTQYFYFLNFFFSRNKIPFWKFLRFSTQFSDVA